LAQAGVMRATVRQAIDRNAAAITVRVNGTTTRPRQAEDNPASCRHRYATITFSISETKLQIWFPE
jgi:hypothetical protein